MGGGKRPLQSDRQTLSISRSLSISLSLPPLPSLTSYSPSLSLPPFSRYPCLSPPLSPAIPPLSLPSSVGNGVLLI